MLLDTSFLIDLMGGRPEATALAKAVDAEGDHLRLPAPVLFELWVGAARPLGGANERAHLEELEAAYDVVSFDRTDARSAGALQAKLRRTGKSLGTVDAQIAGMAIARSEAIVTGDAALASVGHGVPIRTYRPR